MSVLHQIVLSMYAQYCTVRPPERLALLIHRILILQVVFPSLAGLAQHSLALTESSVILAEFSESLFNMPSAISPVDQRADQKQ